MVAFGLLDSKCRRFIVLNSFQLSIMKKNFNDGEQKKNNTGDLANLYSSTLKPRW